MTLTRNKVQLVGRTCVPTIKTTESGLKFAEVRVYVSENFYNNDGELASELMIHSCRAYGKLAEDLQEQYSKTAVFAFEGVLIASTYKLRGWTMRFDHVQLNSFSLVENPHRY